MGDGLLVVGGKGGEFGVVTGGGCGRAGQAGYDGHGDNEGGDGGDDEQMVLGFYRMVSCGFGERGDGGYSWE